MEGGGTDLETPVEWGVQWRHFAPIRVQIIRVELGRIESQLCQNLGFLKPKVVGSNPTTFTVFVFRTPSDPRVHSVEFFGVDAEWRRIRHSRQMLRRGAISTRSLGHPQRRPDSEGLTRSPGFQTANSLCLGPKRPFRLKHRLGPRAGTNPDFELSRTAMNRKFRVETDAYHSLSPSTSNGNLRRPDTGRPTPVAVF